MVSLLCKLEIIYEKYSAFSWHLISIQYIIAFADVFSLLFVIAQNSETWNTEIPFSNNLFPLTELMKSMNSLPNLHLLFQISSQLLDYFSKLFS